MYEWSDKWMLKFHPDKCKTMRIGKSNIDLKEYSLKPGIPSMKYSTAEKDVGITIDNKLSFEKHISDKVNKANSFTVINTTYGDCDRHRAGTVILKRQKAGRFAFSGIFYLYLLRLDCKKYITEL